MEKTTPPYLKPFNGTHSLEKMIDFSKDNRIAELEIELKVSKDQNRYFKQLLEGMENELSQQKEFTYNLEVQLKQAVKEIERLKNQQP